MDEEVKKHICAAGRNPEDNKTITDKRKIRGVHGGVFKVLFNFLFKTLFKIFLFILNKVLNMGVHGGHLK